MNKKTALAAAVGAVLVAGWAGATYTTGQKLKAALMAQAEGWKAAVPADALARGAWWELYGDAQLNGLVEQLNASNQLTLNRLVFGDRAPDSQALLARLQDADGGTLRCETEFRQYDGEALPVLLSAGREDGDDGTPQYVPIDEKHPTDPEVSYGITKLTIEKYLQLYQRLHGIRATILRVANPYGERQRVETAQGAVGVFLHRVLSGQAIDIWGDGEQTRSFCYVDDLIDAFLLLMDSPADLTGPPDSVRAEVLGLLSSSPTKVDDLVRRCQFSPASTWCRAT